MLINFNDIFYPERKLEKIKLTDKCPCNSCAVFKEYEEKAIYGNIAERQFAELPTSCGSCIKVLLWRTDCMRKLRWYEEHDDRLKGDKEK